MIEVIDLEDAVYEKGDKVKLITGYDRARTNLCDCLAHMSRDCPADIKNKVISSLYNARTNLYIALGAKETPKEFSYLNTYKDRIEPKQIPTYNRIDEVSGKLKSLSTFTRLKGDDEELNKLAKYCLLYIEYIINEVEKKGVVYEA